MRTPPKSFFKELFLGNTQLGFNLKRMAERNGVLKGLKDQECEKGNRSKRPPIPYVPVVDEIQEAYNAGIKERTQKIKLPDKTEFHAGIWYTGTPEEFLNHVKQAVDACKRMGYFDKYKDSLDARNKANGRYEIAVQDIETATTAGSDPAILVPLVAQKKAALKEAKAAEKDRVEAAEGFFSLYANLLSVEARHAWDKIIERQIGKTGWTDLKGRQRKSIRTKTRKCFDDCVQHHLLTVFNCDAADQMRVYISHGLKKPTRVSVRAFFTRVEQLNAYVDLLPNLYNSPRAGPCTKPVKKYDEADLAMHLLRMCPETWQNQYDLSKETIPQNPIALLAVLENIEKLGTSSNVPMKPPANNGYAKAAGKSDTNGKRKGTDSSSYNIPKKKRAEKHCVLCQKHGGAAATHNTSECTKAVALFAPRRSFHQAPPTHPTSM